MNEANHPSSTLRRAAKAIIADRTLRVNNSGGLTEGDRSARRPRQGVLAAARMSESGWGVRARKPRSYVG
jgi:hypothetical protein